MSGTQHGGVWRRPVVADRYRAAVAMSVPHAVEHLDVTVRLLSACERPIRRLLDVGCGDGLLAAYILERFPDARAVAFDFSPPMLAAARERFGKGTEHGGRVRVVEADFGDAAWASAVEGQGPFDAIVSRFAIHHQPDATKRAIYGQCFDLLEPGCMFVNIEHVAPASPWIDQLFDKLMVETIHAGTVARDEDADLAEVGTRYADREDRLANILAPVEVQCEWLRAIGFEDVDCYAKIFELAVFGGRKAGLKASCKEPGDED